MVSSLGAPTPAPTLTRRRTRRPAAVARFTTPLHRNFSDTGYRTIIIEKLSVYLTDADADRLADLATGTRIEGLTVDALRCALRGAVRVPTARDLPPGVVTIGSTARVHCRRTGRVQTVHLVFPGDDLTRPDRLVVLTPAGLALLGARVGDLVTWETPDGLHTAQVESVSHPVRPAPRR